METWNQGETGVSGRDTLERGADDRGKNWEVMRNRDRMKENSWRGRREGRVITSKRSLDTEQGQRFHVFWISLAS